MKIRINLLIIKHYGIHGRRVYHTKMFYYTYVDRTIPFLDNTKELQVS